MIHQQDFEKNENSNFSVCAQTCQQQVGKSHDSCAVLSVAELTKTRLNHRQLVGSNSVNVFLISFKLNSLSKGCLCIIKLKSFMAFTDTHKHTHIAVMQLELLKHSPWNGWTFWRLCIRFCVRDTTSLTMVWQVWSCCFLPAVFIVSFIYLITRVQCLTTGNASSLLSSGASISWPLTFFHIKKVDTSSFIIQILLPVSLLAATWAS